MTVESRLLPNYIVKIYFSSLFHAYRNIIYHLAQNLCRQCKLCEDVGGQAGDPRHQQDDPPRQVHPARLPGGFGILPI